MLSGEDPQVEAALRVIRAVDADILVLADVDYDLQQQTLSALADRIGGYDHRFTAPPNRGVQTGQDRDGDGRSGRPEDAQGYAEFAGQGGMAILSRFPILNDAVTDHSRFLWRDLPSGLGTDALPDQRLATTVFWSVPIALPKGPPVNVMTWHATAPVFDGPEDFNGRRNHDEAAFWLHRLTQVTGPVILAGAANLDPVDGDGRPEALLALLAHPRLQDPQPISAGAAGAASRDGGVNLSHRGDPALDTADWPDDAGWPGNLRVDYVLPSAEFRVLDAGVLWPQPDDALYRDVTAASRHRVVWVDLAPAFP